MSQIFLQNQCTILDNSRYIFLVIWVIAEIYVFIGAIIFFLVTYHFFLSFEKKLLLFLLLSLESLRLVPWTGAKLPSASVIYKERKWKQPIMTLVSFSKALTHNCFLKSLVPSLPASSRFHETVRICVSPLAQRLWSINLEQVDLRSCVNVREIGCRLLVGDTMPSSLRTV